MAGGNTAPGYGFIDQFLSEFESLASELRKYQATPSPQRIVDIGQRLQLLSDIFAILAKFPTITTAHASPAREAEPLAARDNLIEFRHRSLSPTDDRKAV